MTRAVMLVASAFLTIALAAGGIACQASPVDKNFGTDAGGDFDAPAREVQLDGAGDAGAD